ncbi:hypothetical protein CSOJ01_12563 [Colletotrichum sojae]|uniref:Zn(2)-C6 fungal-type domain-containing protein n=1 Tax=Colletotrichum sojae TaxID=2175907 RepID=A0A8H6IVG0_9PEZI|nr:hypothetical protein CSOJ01_12563 [Colletotrichum sojae]
MTATEFNRDAAVTPAETPRPPTSGPAASAARKARRYGFACSSCKSRKVKCSGHRPICTGCRRSGEECVWPTPASTETRLREANARIRTLEASMRHPERTTASPDPLNGPESTYTPHTNATSTRSHGRSENSSRPAGNPDADAEGSLWFQVGIGEDGAVIYNGPTSRFHAGSLEENQLAEESNPRRGQIETLQSQYALMDSVWLPLIAVKPSMNGTGVDAAAGMVLLDIYWSWLHPLHSCVYRPILMMDLALGGPYCSNFLLLCIFGLAARHLPEQNSHLSGIGKGEEFIARARELLLVEMAATKPAIATIQGLLILGGRQCAMGKSSEGWLYTGMAIRMIKDIGLHLDIAKLSRLERWTPAEIETRKRLYNSAYIWDKTLSLALGRPPSLTRRPYPAHEILDKVDDQRLWKPVHASEVTESFVASPSWTTSTFCAFCHLHEVTTDMMLLFSSMPRNEEFASQIEELHHRICQWYEEIPKALKIESISELEQSPPPHIVSLNLLYHALHILLMRPYLGSPDKDVRDRSMKVCIEHSKRIHSIHSLYSETFPHRLMTYQVSYCIYTAATVETEELKRASTQQDREDAAARLAAAFRILQKEASHTPGSGRSLDTIRRLLSTGNGQPSTLPAARNAEARAGAVASGPAQQDRRQLRPPGVNLREGAEQNGASGMTLAASGSQAAPNATQFQSAANALPLDEHAFFPTTEGNLWDEDLSYGVTDTGAGFHPDAFPWAVADNMLRNSGFSSFSGAGMVWPSLGNSDGHGGLQ